MLENLRPTQRMVEAAKAVLKRTIYRPGTIAHVLWGPLRGSRLMLRSTPNWASILGRWEPEAARMYSELLRPGDVVYDCGANVGVHSLLFAKLVGSSGRVVAFEPLPEAANDVRLNCALNGVANVDVREQALADVAGRAVFKATKLTTQGSLSGMNGQEGGDLSVVVTTFDEVIAQGAPAPDFVKMDIEGAEGAALRGFELVTRTYPTFAIDLHTPEQDVQVGAFFARHGYDVYRVGDVVAQRTGQTEMLRRVKTLQRGWPDPDGIWGTVIAVHPSRANERLSPALLSSLSTPRANGSANPNRRPG